MSTPRRSARIQSNPAPPQPLQAHPQQHQQQQQQGHMDRWSLPDGYERYIIFAVITVALGFVEPMNTLYGYYHQLCPECRDGFAIRECLATDSSITAKIPPEKMVNRTRQVSDIHAYIDGDIETQEQYLLVVGPRAAGKTTMVESALLGPDFKTLRKGVVRIKFDGSFGLLPSIANRLGMENIPKDGMQLRAALDIAAGPLLFQTAELPPLIIFVEVDRQQQSDINAGDLKQLIAHVKDLTSDSFVAHVIVALSDAYSTFALPADSFRRQIIWVGDFTNEEAIQFMDKRDCLNGNNEARSLILNSTTRAGALMVLCNSYDSSVETVKQGLDIMKYEAAEDIKEILNPDIERKTATQRVEKMRLLLHCLLQYSYDVGIPNEIYFSNGTQQAMWTPKEVAPLFRKAHAFLYDVTRHRYRFYSRIHYNVANDVYTHESGHVKGHCLPAPHQHINEFGGKQYRPDTQEKIPPKVVLADDAKTKRSDL